MHWKKFMKSKKSMYDEKKNIAQTLFVFSILNLIIQTINTIASTIL